MNSITIFINKILVFGNFRITDIPRKARQELLTAFENLKRIDTVFIPELIKLAKKYPGKLIIDSSDNSKYGLKHVCRKLKNLKTSGYNSGFKIVLFLWQVGDYRIPIGFGLWHKQSGSVCDLALYQNELVFRKSDAVAFSENVAPASPYRLYFIFSF